MGGNRTCPDDCPLAVWNNLSPIDRKAQRKPVAKRLFQEGFTQEAIATQLGVSVMTISRDLEGFNTMLKPSRPRGGRPKSNKLQPRRRKNISVNAETAARSILDEGKTYPEAERETGFSNTVLRSAVAREEGRREPQFDRSDLSITAQEKFDAAMRQYKRKHDLDFETRIHDEVKRRIDEIVLPHWKEKIEKAQELYARRKGLMNKDTFNTIRRALHPDSRQSISDKKLGEAFDAFMALEKFLLNEKDSPTEFPHLPRTWADWERAKQTATAKRRARHGSAIRPR
jgi:uncharacterized protein YerC